jgi:phage baseplate assembly protein W
MPTVNTPPPVTDAEIVKTLAFPYQLGQSGFPALSDYNNVVFQSILALLLTGTNERLMHVDMGVNLHRMVFDNLTPILQARIATEVTRAIEDYEPRASVLAVDSAIGTNTEGGPTAIIVDVLYRVNGQPVSQQVEIPLVGTP